MENLCDGFEVKASGSATSERPSVRLCSKGEEILHDFVYLHVSGMIAEHCFQRILLSESVWTTVTIIRDRVSSAMDIYFIVPDPGKSKSRVLVGSVCAEGPLPAMQVVAFFCTLVCWGKRASLLCLSLERHSSCP